MEKKGGGEFDKIANYKTEKYKKQQVFRDRISLFFQTTNTFYRIIAEGYDTIFRSFEKRRISCPRVYPVS
jgi:hypothetical protein